MVLATIFSESDSFAPSKTRPSKARLSPPPMEFDSTPTSRPVKIIELRIRDSSPSKAPTMPVVPFKVTSSAAI